MDEDTTYKGRRVVAEFTVGQLVLAGYAIFGAGLLLGLILGK